MAVKSIFVSDLTGKELAEDNAVRVTVTDKKNSASYVVDADRADDLVKALMEKGKKQAVRGRKADVEPAAK